MATKFYLPSSGAAAVTPNLGSGWEDTSINSNLKCVTTKSSTAMTTVSFADSDVTNKDILYRTWVSDPLAAQTISSQTITGQMRASERVAGCNLFLEIHIYVVSNDGSTITGQIVASGSAPALWNATEVVVTTLTNRTLSVTSASLTINANDRLVIQVGLGGDPSGGGSPDHDGSIRIGDNDANDLPADDTDTTDKNPWINFANTLTFAGGSFTQSADMTAVGSTTRTLIPIKVLSNTGTGAVTRNNNTGKIFSMTAVGVDSFTKLIAPLAKAMTSIGVATESLIANKVFSNIGTGVMTKSSIPGKVFSLTGTGVSSLVRLITPLGKSMTAVGLATTSAFKLFFQNFDITGTGVATFSKIINKIFSMTGSGITTLTRLVSLIKSLTAVGVATFSETLQILKSFSATAIGLATFSLIFLNVRIFSAIGTGLATIQNIVYKVLSMTGVGSVSTSRTVIPGSGGGTAGEFDTKTLSGFFRKLFRRKRRDNR